MHDSDPRRDHPFHRYRHSPARAATSIQPAARRLRLVISGGGPPRPVRGPPSRRRSSPALHLAAPRLPAPRDMSTGEPARFGAPRHDPSPTLVRVAASPLVATLVGPTSECPSTRAARLEGAARSSAARAAGFVRPPPMQASAAKSAAPVAVVKTMQRPRSTVLAAGCTARAPCVERGWRCSATRVK